MLAKRKRPSRDDVEPRRSLALDGDVAIGTEHLMHKTCTYALDALGGALERYVVAATRSTSDEPAIGVCDEWSTVLLINKMYGESVLVPVKNSTVVEPLHLFSMFECRQRTKLLDPEQFVYQPQYGGLTDVGAEPLDASKRVYEPRPLAMCRRTADVMARAGSEWGWRALLYESSGPDDRFPTGIVAIEGFLFELVDAQHSNARTGKTYQVKDARDVDDVDVVAQRVGQLVAVAQSMMMSKA